MHVIADLSPSLDGYVAGSGVSVDRPFGDADMSLYRWRGLEDEVLGPADQESSATHLDDAGAIVLGRTMFDVGIGPWGEDGAFRRPCFVVTHRQQEDLVRGPTTFSFVDGLHEALSQAAAVAGEKAVMVVGGASLVRQCLAARLVDELRLHIAPVLLGAGRTVYDGDERLQQSLELIEAKATPLALHVRYRVLRDLS